MELCTRDGDESDMMQAGRVRLLVALIAAGGVHALFLLWPSSPTIDMIHNGTLRVDLSNHETVADRPGSHRRQVSESIPRTETQAAPVHTPSLSPTSHASTLPQHARKHMTRNKAVSRVARVPGRHVPSSRPVERHQLHVDESATPRRPAKITDHTSASAAASTAPGRISSRARALLLAHIEYPRPARRRGWRGLGTFQLLIVREGVRRVTMLASTGHGLLDQAAVRGLMGAGRIPLKDGVYDLPVEFRLQ